VGVGVGWWRCVCCVAAAPELVSKGDDDRAGDWWRLGVLLYELAVGFPPIRLPAKPAAAASATASASAPAPSPTAAGADAIGSSPELRALIMGFQPSALRFPPFVSAEFKDVVLRLLTVDRSKRLGAKLEDAKEVMRHPWFVGLGSGPVAAASAAVSPTSAATSASAAPQPIEPMDWPKAEAGACYPCSPYLRSCSLPCALLCALRLVCRPPALCCAVLRCELIACGVWQMDA
jgi:hypothetical protein